VLLAQLGTVALARAMSWTPMRLVTDLRIRDNVNREESYFLADGMHRLEGARAFGLREIPADVRKGSRRDALLYAVNFPELRQALEVAAKTSEDARKALALIPEF